MRQRIPDGRHRMQGLALRTSVSADFGGVVKVSITTEQMVVRRAE